MKSPSCNSCHYKWVQLVPLLALVAMQVPPGPAWSMGKLLILKQKTGLPRRINKLNNNKNKCPQLSIIFHERFCFSIDSVIH